jgi:hypothetical protein
MDSGRLLFFVMIAMPLTSPNIGSVVQGTSFLLISSIESRRTGYEWQKPLSIGRACRISHKRLAIQEVSFHICQASLNCYIQNRICTKLCVQAIIKPKGARALATGIFVADSGIPSLFVLPSALSSANQNPDNPFRFRFFQDQPFDRPNPTRPNVNNPLEPRLIGPIEGHGR